MAAALDIGHGVTITFTEYQGERVGLIEEHDSPAGRCSGSVWFRGTKPTAQQPTTWEVVQAEPLTLSPSILCRTCGHHGYIRGGRWVPA